MSESTLTPPTGVVPPYTQSPANAAPARGRLRSL